MKKITKTIAMILVLVILINSFTSCFSLTAIYTIDKPALLILTIPLDIITLPIQLLIFTISVMVTSSEMESQIYLANAEYNPFKEYYPLMEKIYFLPEVELASLKQALNSIPEAERIFLIEKLISLSETKRVSLVSVYNSLSEREIVSSIKRISSLSETELVFLLQTFNSLSEAELDSLVEELKFLHETEYIALVDYSRKKAYTGLRFQY